MLGPEAADRDIGSLRLENAAELRGIIHSLAEGVVVADRNGRFQFFNAAALDMLGIGDVDVDPSDWSRIHGCFLADKKTLYPADELPLARAIRGLETTEELIFVRNDRNPTGLWLSVNACPLLGRAGERRGGVAVYLDVTAGKRAQGTAERAQGTAERLQGTADRLYNAVEQAADLVIITDTSGIIEYVNPALKEITGHAVADVLGKQPKLFNSGIHDRSFFEKMWSTLLRGEVFKGTITNRKRNGSLFYMQQTISPIKNSNGEFSHFVSVGRDITAQMSAEEQATKMRFARAVQQRFYPSISPRLTNFDISGAAFPADATGGDYYDFVSMPDGKLCVAVGDVSGHGFDTALLMSETRAYVRSLAGSYSDVGEVLTRVNAVLKADIEDNRFITMILCQFDPESRSFSYSSAGHETGYVIDSAGRVRTELRSSNVPLGLFGETIYETSPPVNLAPGEIAVLLTDGVTDAEALDGSMFNQDRALELIAAHRKAPAEKIVELLYSSVRRFISGHKQSDDITVVICKSRD